MKRDTICALCTLPGKSALSVIRVSGPKALEITKKQAPFLPTKIESHRAYVGTLRKDDKEIDQVVLTYFSEGKSFTGEETLEISCHGGFVYSEILKGLLKDGARLAERGEFSFQSFLNGKMDLVQAEGLYQLIESKNKLAHLLSFQQLKGSLSKKLEELEKKWLKVLSHIEADIDFSLENLHTFSEKDIEKDLRQIQSSVKFFIDRYQPFEKFQQGLTCGLFGLVNSGKSTLFNAFLEQDKAIVSEEEGTTRDIVESVLENPKGLNINLKDTAGFRSTKSKGEQKGQERSKEQLVSSDIQVFVVDSSTIDSSVEELLKALDKKSLKQLLAKSTTAQVLVFTKKDLCSKEVTKEKLLKKIQEQQSPIFSNISKDHAFFISALQQEGLQKLKETLFLFGRTNGEDFLITNYRHYKGLRVMEDSLKQALETLTNHGGEKDIIALELRRGLIALYEILGKQIDDQILDNVFKQFCIGK